MAPERISPDELERRMKSEEVLVIDVRSKEKYEKGHVPGAIHMPVRELRRSVHDLPRDRQIVTY